jgi:hypothetical protein
LPLSIFRALNESAFYTKNIFKKLSESEEIDAKFFIKTQYITAEACGESKRSIQRICSEVKKNDQLPETGSSFSSPRKSYKRTKYVSELDDFGSDVVRRTVHEFYDRSEYPISELTRQKSRMSAALIPLLV